MWLQVQNRQMGAEVLVGDPHITRAWLGWGAPGVSPTLPFSAPPHLDSAFLALFWPWVPPKVPTSPTVVLASQAPAQVSGCFLVQHWGREHIGGHSATQCLSPWYLGSCSLPGATKHRPSLENTA